MKTALDAFDQIQKKAKGIKDPTINMKRFSQGLKSAERELDKLNKKASKPRVIASEKQSEQQGASPCRGSGSERGRKKRTAP
jgi:soluble cytochrome b562